MQSNTIACYFQWIETLLRRTVGEMDIIVGILHYWKDTNQKKRTQVINN